MASDSALREEVERQEFEAWAARPGDKSSWPAETFARDSHGYYAEITLEIAWEAWQARGLEVRQLRERVKELEGR